MQENYLPQNKSCILPCQAARIQLSCFISPQVARRLNIGHNMSQMQPQYDFRMIEIHTSLSHSAAFTVVARRLLVIIILIK